MNILIHDSPFKAYSGTLWPNGWKKKHQNYAMFTSSKCVWPLSFLDLTEQTISSVSDYEFLLP